MTGMHLRAALVTAIYRKTLVLSNSSRQKSTVGEVIFRVCSTRTDGSKLIIRTLDCQSHERRRSKIDGFVYLLPHW